MTESPSIDPERLIPPPSALRPALAAAMRRVRLLRGLLRLSESVAQRNAATERTQHGTEAPAHATH